MKRIVNIMRRGFIPWRRVSPGIGISGVFLFLLASAGCTHVAADSYAVPSVSRYQFEQGSTFHVQENIMAPNQIFDNTVKNKIETALQHHGFQIAPREQADYVLTYGYDIQGHERTEFDPAYSLHPHFDHFGYVGGLRHDHFHTHLGFNHYVARTYTVYTSMLRLTVYEGQVERTQDPGAEQTKADVLWIGETWTESVERDLKNKIDYLIAASMRTFGEQTKDVQDVYLTGGNDLIDKLQKQ